MSVIMFSILNRHCLLIDKEKIFSKLVIKIFGALNHPINVLVMPGGAVTELATWNVAFFYFLCHFFFVEVLDGTTETEFACGPDRSLIVS